jgi:hypothetical protein
LDNGASALPQSKAVGLGCATSDFAVVQPSPVVQLCKSPLKQLIFQEDTVKLKIALAIAAFALCCSFASAQSYEFGLITASGAGTYCNFPVFYSYGYYALGYIDEVSVCGDAQDADLFGVLTSPPADVLVTGMTGKMFFFSSNELDALDGADSGETTGYWIKEKCSPKIKSTTKYGWELADTEYYDIEYVNYGYLGCSAPSKAEMAGGAHPHANRVGNPNGVTNKPKLNVQ